MSMPVAYKLTY